jgi:hypothetical protein
MPQMGYSQGDVFPGFSLAAQVTRVDFDTDSHYAYLTLKVGLTNDASSQTI